MSEGLKTIVQCTKSELQEQLMAKDCKVFDTESKDLNWAWFTLAS